MHSGNQSLRYLHTYFCFWGSIRAMVLECWKSQRHQHICISSFSQNMLNKKTLEFFASEVAGLSNKMRNKTCTFKDVPRFQKKHFLYRTNLFPQLIVKCLCPKMENKSLPTQYSYGLVPGQWFPHLQSDVTSIIPPWWAGTMGGDIHLIIPLIVPASSFFYSVPDASPAVSL